MCSSYLFTLHSGIPLSEFISGPWHHQVGTQVLFPGLVEALVLFSRLDQRWPVACAAHWESGGGGRFCNSSKWSLMWENFVFWITPKKNVVVIKSEISQWLISPEWPTIMGSLCPLPPLLCAHHWRWHIFLVKRVQLQLKVMFHLIPNKL